MNKYNQRRERGLPIEVVGFYILLRWPRNRQIKWKVIWFCYSFLLQCLLPSSSSMLSPGLSLSLRFGYGKVHSNRACNFIICFLLAQQIFTMPNDSTAIDVVEVAFSLVATATARRTKLHIYIYFI